MTILHHLFDVGYDMHREVMRELLLPIRCSFTDALKLVSVDELAEVLCCVGDFTEFGVAVIAQELGSRELYVKWKKKNKEFRSIYE